jgi:hypothetical protein
MICLNSGMATLLAGESTPLAAPLMRGPPENSVLRVTLLLERPGLPEFPVGTHFRGNCLPQEKYLPLW